MPIARKTDFRGNVNLRGMPSAKGGQVFELDPQPDGSILLTPVGPPWQTPGPLSDEEIDEIIGEAHG